MFFAPLPLLFFLIFFAPNPIHYALPVCSNDNDNNNNTGTEPNHSPCVYLQMNLKKTYLSMTPVCQIMTSETAIR